MAAAQQEQSSVVECDALLPAYYHPHPQALTQRQAMMMIDALRPLVCTW